MQNRRQSQGRHVIMSRTLPRCRNTFLGHVLACDETLTLLTSDWRGTVPSSDPVNVPKRRPSASEEHSPGNVSQTASAERSLLSQQIRLNSENSLSQMSNGSAAHAASPLDAAEPQVGSSRQSFSPLPVPKQESGGDGSSQLMNGGLPVTNGALQNGPILDCFGIQPSAGSQSHMQHSPSIEWQSRALPDTRDQQQAQVPDDCISTRVL